MKVGMIFECGPDGADKKVCEYLARKLDPKIEIVPITLDNKPKLEADCGRVAAQLLKDGCDRVVIIWDLFPPWRDKRPCRREDREAIMTSLVSAEVTSSNVYLVCIEEELEAWLIADGHALSIILSRPTHHVRIADQRRPDHVRNPKGRLKNLFRQHGRGQYNDLIDAERIVRSIEDWSRLRRSESFVRFALKATDVHIE